jgi:hypothetical protein
MLFKVKYCSLENGYVQQIFLTEECIHTALEHVTEYLAEHIDDEWEILSIKTVINFVDDLEENDSVYQQHTGKCNECGAEYIGASSCPTCVAHVCDPKLLMEFDCPQCKEKLKFANVAWNIVYCPKCNEQIERNNVKFSDGIWSYKKGESK